MNYETIIVAVLALCGTLAGSFISGNKTTALILYRLEMLEKKVEKHNSVVERTYNIEKNLAESDAHIAEIRAAVNRLLGKE